MNYLGVDLGTSSVKLILMDAAGKILRTVSKEYPLSMPHTGWSEQAPEDWWTQTKAGILELMAGLDASQLAGVSFGGQMHGLVILDKEDRVIRPAILWNDGRTGAETAYLNDRIGQDKLAAYTANIAFAGFTAPKLLWVKNHEPQNFARIAKIMLPKDYIAYKMTGVHCCDYSDASGMLLLDVAGKRWSKEMLEICGVTEAQLPALFESYDCVGTLLPSAARELGLPERVKVMAGAGDNAAAAVGTGTVKNGTCNISLGTSGTVFIANDRFRLPENHALHAFAHATGKYHLMGCILSAASCNKWWTEDILKASDYAAEQRGFVPGGENEVLFAPYLMGERTPHNDPSARGAFIGLSMNTTRAQMTQAILEGVTFAVRDSVEIARGLGVDIQRTKICGGGAKSPIWKQMVADVLRMPVESIATEEGPGLGAAMLAAVGCGEYQSVEEIADAMVQVTSVAEPDAKAADRYDAAYARFQKIYPALKPVLG
ncbi:MAG: xylulokinase [Oscillospiraceae bacterium]|nr:xylulokinase [Oscillospiraceae bacterium]